jgi:hypothetical protein
MADPPIVAVMSESSPTSVPDDAVAPAAAVIVGSVSPMPSDEDVVAIIAGLEALWPRPVVVADETPHRSTAWRFSGRWWSRPVPARRDRPYR